MTDAPKGLPVSVQVRLVQHAKATGIDPNAVLARYAAERFLYRLSTRMVGISKFARISAGSIEGLSPGDCDRREAARDGHAR